MKNYDSSWDAETGIATCTLTYQGAKFTGKAQCHDQDRDFCSEKTGLSIAEKRAMLKLSKKLKNDARLRYETLERLYKILSNNGKIEPNSYEMNVVYQEMMNFKTAYILYKEGIKSLYQELKEFISNKATIYSILRKNRAKANDGQK